MKWQIVLSLVSFGLLVFADVATETRVSENQRVVTKATVTTGTVLKATGKPDVELSSVAVEQIEILRNKNQVQYSYLISALVSGMQETGDMLEAAVTEMNSSTVKLTSKQMVTLKRNIRKLKREQDKVVHFTAYLRALGTCIEMVPVSNETLQMSSMGIQSRWCQDMRNTQEAKYVSQMLVWYSQLTSTDKSEALSNRDVINEAIVSLVKTGYIKMKN